jgi:murein DD-endopeptidase MepM/ murein hydrolase activator NlpD
MMEKPKRGFFKLGLVVSAVAWFAACSGAAIASRAPNSLGLAIDVPNEAVAEGSVFLMSVRGTDGLKNVVGHFQGHVIEFYPEQAADGLRYTAVVGVEYGTQPGKVTMQMRADLNGKVYEEPVEILVKAGTFPFEKLRVPPRTVTPTKRDQKIIARDRIALSKVYAMKTESKFWDPPSIRPVEFPVTSAFGTARIYNGKKESAHLGTDLRAPIGTAVHAPLAGRVALAKKLFYTGYTVILDHGYGMFSIYGHMSKLRVKVGRLVVKGQVLGLSGATGRASGPHLHWGVKLHGVNVDPVLLTQTLDGAVATSKGVKP